MKFQHDGKSKYNLVWTESVLNHIQDTYTEMKNVILT
jgi:hypothetical protein